MIYTIIKLLCVCVCDGRSAERFDLEAEDAVFMASEC